MTCAETNESDSSDPRTPPDPKKVTGRQACLSLIGMSVAVVLFASAIVAVVVTVFNVTH